MRKKVWGNCKKSLAISFANFSVAKQKQIANNKSNQSEILLNKCYILYLNNKDDKIYKQQSKGHIRKKEKDKYKSPNLY